MKSILALLTLTVSLSACKQQIKVKDDSTIITNVNVVDVRSGKILVNQHVVISDGQTQDIIPDEGQEVKSTSVIKGDGLYMVPGLTEMHAHIPSPAWGRNLTKETLFLYLSNGVTTIRGMLGHPAHLELREQALNSEILSPRIFTSSPSVNGNTFPDKATARKLIPAYKEAGYDFLKIHPGIKLDVFEEIVEIANNNNIGFAGHVPIDVGIHNALSSKYLTIDHIDGFLEGLVPSELGVDPSANGFFGYDFTDLANVQIIDSLVAKSKENGVWVVPTQSLFDRWFSPADPRELASEDEMKYMPASTIENWVESKQGLISGETYDPEKWKRFNDIRRKLLFTLNENGQGLLLGSDAPQVFNVPGFSIHHEMKGMSDAGISNLDIIRSGTLNPAKFFDAEGEFGEIVPGASADFILIEGNPLEDLDNLKKLKGVMVRGNWLSKEEIDSKLEEIAERMSKL